MVSYVVYEIRFVKPEIRNFEVVKGSDAWKEVVYSARMSGVPPDIPEDKVFQMIVKNDYGSALEHIIIKFDLKMTKGNAPELLEHRIASHSGYSTRYIKVFQEAVCKEENAYEVILPTALLKDPQKKEAVMNVLSRCFEAYEKLLAMGSPKEHARYILPFCLAVGIYHYTINLRSLLNLLSLRLCVRASPEFRCLASQLYFNLTGGLPILRGLVGCRGFMRGVCPESGVTGIRAGKQHPFYPPCPFKNPESDVYIPTVNELRIGGAKQFNVERAVEVQERIFRRWSEWKE
ncbi:MAG: FAD-dependent thymidylate synthase [Candidatus Bathyarchaeota archaeon]|nr:FAD-dependent thymidylate synthase [Candidatus Bathyarchaeota archaeon]